MIKKINVMLIGFMGVGKTSVSRELSKKLDMPEIDMDKIIVDRENKSINDIFTENGEEYFRKIETECLIDIQKSKGYIVSCGGGVVVKDENINHMKDGGVILLLTATPETVYNRVKDDDSRPILKGNKNVEFIEQLMNKRKDRYLAVADIIISTDDKTISEIVDEITDKLEEFAKK
ncbi:MAG: shikimate kinase [Lachnospiraceae bacterium]|nr:shikimate kinase [Lachnospiraceae bacterium]